MLVTFWGELFSSQRLFEYGSVCFFVGQNEIRKLFLSNFVQVLSDMEGGSPEEGNKNFEICEMNIKALFNYI